MIACPDPAPVRGKFYPNITSLSLQEVRVVTPPVNSQPLTVTNTTSPQRETLLFSMIEFHIQISLEIHTIIDIY